MNLAPIILFVYNRPEHTKRVLQALSNNKEAQESVLYIFADGPKKIASKNELKTITETRKVIRERQWCGEVIIREQDSNIGLSQSVINGVTKVLSNFDAAIILEDDIVVNSGFLKYMNRCLKIYKEEKRVFGISAFTFESKRPITDKTFFLPVMSSWGYGVWSDRWQSIDFNAERLMNKVLKDNLEKKMKFADLDFYQMLQDQLNGIIDSWAVRFYTSMILQNGLFLFPHKSLLTNIGLDGSGVHCGKVKSELSETIKELDVEKIEVRIDSGLMKKFGDPYQKDFISLKNLKKKIRNSIPPELLSYIRRKRGVQSTDKFDFLRETPRFIETKIPLDGSDIIIPDAASFLFMYKEIFEREIYKFKTSTDHPYIIDGGANIGLSAIYFRQLYPTAQIVAFEPDPYIYNILKINVSKHDFDNIDCINKGLWDEETDLTFHSEGADGGTMHLTDQYHSSNVIHVKTTSLLPYLNKKVDFLKIDIEGAEFKVLENVKEKLSLVENIFVEYHSFINIEQNLPELLSILKESGFRLHLNAPGLSSEQPFINLSTYNNMDMQLNIYGYRES